MIEDCNRIIAAYDKDGFSLTLRQLYYHLEPLIDQDILTKAKNKLHADRAYLEDVYNEAKDEYDS